MTKLNMTKVEIELLERVENAFVRFEWNEMDRWDRLSVLRDLLDLQMYYTLYSHYGTNCPVWEEKIECLIHKISGFHV